MCDDITTNTNSKANIMASIFDQLKAINSEELWSNKVGLLELFKRFHALINPIGRIDEAIRKLTKLIFKQIEQVNISTETNSKKYPMSTKLGDLINYSYSHCNIRAFKTPLAKRVNI